MLFVDEVAILARKDWVVVFEGFVGSAAWGFSFLLKNSFDGYGKN